MTRSGSGAIFSASAMKIGDVVDGSVTITNTGSLAGSYTLSGSNSGSAPLAVQLQPNRVGRVEFSIPVAGYVLWYGHTREVRAALIAFAALAVLAGLLRRIWGQEPAAVRGDGIGSPQSPPASRLR